MKRSNIEKCRDLRKNQTDTEKKLWSRLRDRQIAGVKFRRQFSMGKYIIDFYAPAYKIGIEADGGQHYEDRGKLHDELRSNDLSREGVQILRFSNKEVLENIEDVCEVIFQTIEKKKITPSP